MSPSMIDQSAWAVPGGVLLASALSGLKCERVGGGKHRPYIF